MCVPSNSAYSVCDSSTLPHQHLYYWSNWHRQLVKTSGFSVPIVQTSVPALTTQLT